MDQQSSNANMPRDTVETLKQIQKQGLSISIVKGSSASFSLPSPAPAEIRPKQNALPVDKTSKPTSVTPRSQATTETKTQILQTRLSNNVETRVPPGRATTQTSFHDTKTTPNQTRPSQPASSESKGFSPSWSSPISIADKSQGTTSRPMVTSASKIQPTQVRTIIPENKTPVSRSNQSMLSENKNQPRVTPGQRLPQNQHLMEGKIQTNPDRVNLNPTSPSDTKVFPNQARAGQQFVVTQDNKTIPVQRVAPLKSGDVKSANLISVNKQDVKTAQVNRMVHNVKVTSEVTQNKSRQQNYTVKDDGKPNTSGNTPMIVENKVNSVRTVTNTVDGSATRTTQSKTSTHMRLPSNAAGGDTPGVQTKMIYSSTVHTTKMICIQSVQGVTENKMILQGAQTSTSDVMHKASTTLFDVAPEPSPGGPGGPVSARVATSKRSSVFTSTPVKKKSLKRTPVTPAEMNSKSLDGSNLNSSEEGNENETQLFNNLKKASRSGLTITPVHSSMSMQSPSATATGVVKIPSGEMDKEVYQALWEKTQIARASRGKPRSRGRRKYSEPVVCYTLSSDEEEERMQYNNFEEAFAHEGQLFPQESEEGSKSSQSSPNYHDENDPGCDDDEEEDDDPEFPGVTNISPRTPEVTFPASEEEEEEEEREMGEMDEMEVDEEDSMNEEEEEEMDESEMEEEEEVPPEEEEDHNVCKGPMENASGIELPLRCRSVRIGSFKVHPKPTNATMNVYLASDGISFNAPMVSDCNKIVNITVKPSDITQMLVHFGKCLPILFVLTTPSFAEAIRKSLNMLEIKHGYYDPTSNDEKVKKITFLIDNVNEEQRRFLRHAFLNDKKIRELDQKTANEILVTSTPSQQIVRCEVAQPQIQPQYLPISSENIVSVTAVQTSVTTRQTPSLPVTRLLTYPPPPQTGGIPITNEDLACLNEGEFLNDVIIDFYLKYLYNEKLSDYHRDKTHIFSSYFFPRLTYKPERTRNTDEIQKDVQMRRHSQVKTWTRHVDIFSKDFIIIPVNQNVHWFLAIICYPGLVPETSESPVKPDLKTNKSIDNVSSTDDQDENKSIKEANSSSAADGNSHNSDENSTASSNSMYEQEEQDSEEPISEAADSSTHPEKVRRKKEAPCICIFDSLNGPNRSRIVTMLREYLEVEWKMRKGTRKIFDKTTMHGYIMQCPQQTNYSDCGIYVLQYVESFFENPIPYFDSPIPNLTNWFPKEKVAKKRQELKDLILSLQKKYSNTTAIRNTNISENVPSSQAQVLQTDNR